MVKKTIEKLHQISHLLFFKWQVAVSPSRRIKCVVLEHNFWTVQLGNLFSISREPKIHGSPMCFQRPSEEASKGGEGFPPHQFQMPEVKISKLSPWFLSSSIHSFLLHVDSCCPISLTSNMNAIQNDAFFPTYFWHLLSFLRYGKKSPKNLETSRKSKGRYFSSTTA